MKFKFCGDLDCPDWILSEISILSKISSVKLKLFCQQVMNELVGDEINYDKIHKFTTDAKYTPGDVKAAVSATDYIFCNAAKFNVESETLSNELQQLGLPKELATSFCKVYNDNYEKLREVLKSKSLRLSTLKSVDWRVDYVLSSSSLEDAHAPEVQIQITETDEKKAFSFTASSQKFRILLSELKEAYKHMEGLSS